LNRYQRSVLCLLLNGHVTNHEIAVRLAHRGWTGEALTDPCIQSAIVAAAAVEPRLRWIFRSGPRCSRKKGREVNREPCGNG